MATLFSNGIMISQTEQLVLFHVEADSEQWLRNSVTERARLRRDALIKEWQPRLFADPAVTELPADNEALCTLIMARDDYKTRLQQDAAQNPPVPLHRHNTTMFEERIVTGPMITLFADGFNISNLDRDCLLAYAQDLEDSILGALLGHINRGKKKMIRQYYPIIMADSNVDTMPATEDGLINMIVARDDYKAMHR